MVAFAILNTVFVDVNILGWHIPAALGSVCFVTFMLGALCVFALRGTQKIKDTISEQKQVEWQKQDHKLAKEIQSDKEKQLEAKILTLEAALKSALEKKKKNTPPA